MTPWESAILGEQNIVTLSVAKWLKVIRYVNASSDADKYMFVLRLWANAQVVKNTSYQAFDGLVGENASDLTAVTLRIEQITEWVEVAMGSSSALLDVRQLAVCQLDESAGTWTVSSEQCVNLRQAIGFSNRPVDSW
ncbi:MAG: hypothetical protein HN523_02630 [Porticoccaceae bacterium]|nr:hypothetical protein [Porticoccaceae bacterium]